jgi:hypothetical protein
LPLILPLLIRHWHYATPLMIRRHYAIDYW